MEFPFERAAMHGEPMPEELRLHEQAAYQAMRHLYAVYQQGGISREAAAREKRLIYAAFEKERMAFENSREAFRVHAELWKNIEAAGNRFGRERTIENAEAFVAAVYGCGLKPKEEQK